MASGLWGFGLYTEIKKPLLAKYVSNISYTWGQVKVTVLVLDCSDNLKNHKEFQNAVRTILLKAKCLIRSGRNDLSSHNIPRQSEV